MKLKETPADFRVTELLEFDASSHGEYHVHLLHKEKLTTHEALGILVRYCRVRREDLAYAGLKDRQAITEQYITVRGRRLEFDGHGIRVRPLGRMDRPLTSKLSSGNAFEITVRDLSRHEAVEARRELPSISSTGFPNYFDDQRFGCITHGQGFVMRQVLEGNYERALRQLIASPSDVAVTGDVKLKRILANAWGDWERCRDVARGPIYKPVFEYLVRHPNDFRGALEGVPTRIKLIHAFAFQSFLWNRAMSRLLGPRIPFAKRLILDTIVGRLAAWRYLDRELLDDLQRMATPLYGPEGDGGDPLFRRAMEEQLQDAGLRRRDFLEHKVPGMILVEEPRPAVVMPAGICPVDVGPDSLHEGKLRAVLRFRLPRGTYATMLLKRLFAPTAAELRRRRNPRGAIRYGGRS